MLLHATFIPHIMQKFHKPFSIYQFLKVAFVVEYLNIFQKFIFHVVQDNSKLDLSLTTQISSCRACQKSCCLWEIRRRLIIKLRQLCDFTHLDVGLFQDAIGCKSSFLRDIANIQRKDNFVGRKELKTAAKKLKRSWFWFTLVREAPVRPSGIPTGRRGARYITASSSWDKHHAPWRARLHQRVTGRYRGGWSARKNNRRQYLHFDLKKPRKVVKVVTQGRYDAKQWVTSFIISYSQDKYRWIRYKKYGRVKVRD